MINLIMKVCKFVEFIFFNMATVCHITNHSVPLAVLERLGRRFTWTGCDYQQLERRKLTRTIGRRSNKSLPKCSNFCPKLGSYS